MRNCLMIAAVAFLISFASAAKAELADKRSFFHPLGFWSNEGFVKQKRIYLPQSEFDTEPSHHSHPGYELGGNGGGVMHELNWQRKTPTIARRGFVRF